MKNYSLFLTCFYKSGRKQTYKCFDRMVFRNKSLYLFYDEDMIFRSYRKRIDLSNVTHYVFFYRCNEYVTK